MIPGGAVQLLKTARAAGRWWCFVQHHRGARPDGQPVDSVLVKGRHPTGRSFVAQYLDGKAVSAYKVTAPTPGTGRRVATRVGVRDLKTWIGAQR